MTTPNQPKPPTGRTLQPTKMSIQKVTGERVYPDTAPDNYGQVKSGDKDRSRLGKAPNVSAEDHYHSDVDSGQQAQHHTLGTGRNQAAPGNHIHDGITSKEIVQTGTESISFVTQSAFTKAVAFPNAFTAVPVVMVNIATNDASTARWDARAVGITATGFTLSVFKGDNADAAATWTNIPVQWMATL
jgi:hypothetical protein